MHELLRVYDGVVCGWWQHCTMPMYIRKHHTDELHLVYRKYYSIYTEMSSFFFSIKKSTPGMEPLHISKADEDIFLSIFVRWRIFRLNNARAETHTHIYTQKAFQT